MSNVKRRTNKTRVVRGRKFNIECIEWKDSDGLSFDVSDDDTGLLLHNESFDEDPGVVEIEDLLDRLQEDLENNALDEELFDNEDVETIRRIIQATGTFIDETRAKT